ncbi:hypothetical protein IEQ34_017938 [Dendrobium chrysotoxum]|uniref:Maturase K n=1 Tax=Dendrobium chrysotoxum TaxID=161865 RepID=A0AAV7FVE8_DENCH|nr:hypothetical protein IEQ34_017938 [Dendrobium chrysotoxum]
MSLRFARFVLFGFDSSNVFSDLNGATHRGLFALWISEEEVQSLVQPFKFFLIEKFPLRRSVLNSIHKFLFNLKFLGGFSATVVDQRHVLIMLSNDLDYRVSNCSYLNFILESPPPFILSSNSSWLRFFVWPTTSKG